MRRPPPASWLLALLLLPCAGCGGANGGYDVNPPADVARAALEQSLNAWRGGGKPGTIEGASPPVQVVDSAWQGGQQLAGYEIVGEEAGEMDKRFTVRLSLKKAAKPKEVRYIVLGRGPVWVYRDEDYQRMLNMDNNPSTPKRRG
jgi:hypothetical protein